jgi:TonB family protein
VHGIGEVTISLVVVGEFMIRIGAIVLAFAFSAMSGLARGTIDAQPQNRRAQISRVVPVSAAVLVRLVQKRTLPQYPEEALRAGIQGDVILKILVDEAGKIVLGKPVEGDPLLIATSVEALRNIRFRPYRLNGNPVGIESQLGFHFRTTRKGENAKGQVEFMTTVPYQQEFRTGLLSDIGALVIWPHKLSGAEPHVPTELVGTEGAVYVTVTVGIEGKVQDVKVIWGDQPFIDLVVDAVKQFVYEPQLIEGRPSVATIPVSYHFGRQQ